MIQSCRFILVLLLAITLPLLTAATARAAEPDPSASAASGDFAGLVKVGGRDIYLECHGTGGPTVILVSGYRDSLEVWSKDFEHPTAPLPMVLPGVGRFTHVCAYDRPGTVRRLPDGTFVSGRSTPVSGPRTAGDVMTELHALLHTAGVPGPYVLVGHSIGGLFARLYASTYPNEVAGLVLVDALSESIQTRLTANQWATHESLIQQVPVRLKGIPDLETIKLEQSFTQIRKAAEARPLRQMPLVVLSHGKPLDLPMAPASFSQVLEPAWAASQTDLAELVPHSLHIVATASGHYIQQDEPELVIDVIRQVVTAVRDHSLSPVPAAGSSG